MPTLKGMKLSIFFLCVSAGQSFLSKQRPAFCRDIHNSVSRSYWRRPRSTLCAEALTGTSRSSLKSHSVSSGTKVLADSDDFVKPDRDRRDYRYIKLGNNLRVLLVSTKNTCNNEENSASVEAAAVHVQAGHFDDEIAGISHFNEHMVFLGTEKFPGEEDYEGWLSKFGGYSNAYTDMEDTNYYFSITTQQSDSECVSEGLAGALDRFAQFFIAPRFEESMVERELRAIDSEYRNGKTSDAWRNYQLLKSIANPKHPFSK